MNIFDSIDETQRRFFLFRQSEEYDNISHLQKIKNLTVVMEHVGIDMFKDKCYTKHVENFEIMSDDEIKNEIRNRRIVVCFLKRSNQKIYGKLLSQLRDQYLMGQDNYPTTLEKAFKLLQNNGSTKTHGMQKPSNNKEQNSSSD